VLPYMMVDCSHDNSGQDYKNQPKVMANICEQIREGSEYLVGVMLESHLVAGKQNLPKDKDTEKISSQLVYGQSITDGCVDFETTAELLRSLAAAVKAGRFENGN
jgi:3-deoxy-7-phosphoheptulonate synthase